MLQARQVAGETSQEHGQTHARKSHAILASGWGVQPRLGVCEVGKAGPRISETKGACSGAGKEGRGWLPGARMKGARRPAAASHTGGMLNNGSPRENPGWVGGIKIKAASLSRSRGDVDKSVFGRGEAIVLGLSDVALWVCMGGWWCGALAAPKFYSPG